MIPSAALLRNVPMLCTTCAALVGLRTTQKMTSASASHPAITFASMSVPEKLMQQMPVVCPVHDNPDREEDEHDDCDLPALACTPAVYRSAHVSVPLPVCVYDYRDQRDQQCQHPPGSPGGTGSTPRVYRRDHRRGFRRDHTRDEPHPEDQDDEDFQEMPPGSSHPENEHSQDGEHTQTACRPFKPQECLCEGVSCVGDAYCEIVHPSPSGGPSSPPILRLRSTGGTMSVTTISPAISRISPMEAAVEAIESPDVTVLTPCAIFCEV